MGHILTSNQLDSYTKIVLRYTSVTAKILKDYVSELKNLSLFEIIQILNQENSSNRISIYKSEDVTEPNSKVFFNLLIRAETEQEGIFTDIEPQGRFESGDTFNKRSLYTASRMITGQRNNSDRFPKNESAFGLLYMPLKP